MPACLQHQPSFSDAYGRLQRPLFLFVLLFVARLLLFMVGFFRRLPKGGLAEGGFGFGRKAVVFGVWAAPGGFETIQKGGGHLFGWF